MEKGGNWMPKGCSNPGHGGKDCGAVGLNSLEKDLNLKISLQFAQRMRQHGFEMVETRTADNFISLSAIADMANRAGCDFFQSNHCNAGKGTGFEIYALPGGNAEKYARIMERHLAQALGIRDRGVKTDQKYYVLVHTSMPAILVELAFVDNPSDESLLLNDQWRSKAVEAMVQAWCEIYRIGYKPLNKPPVQPKPPEPSKPVVSPPGTGRKELADQALQQLAKVGEIVKKLAE